MSVEVYEMQSTFCPNGDSHHIASETFLPYPGDPNALIDYLIRCGTCRFFGVVHAQKRWRLKGDYRRLFKSEAEALGAASDQPAAPTPTTGGE